MDAATNESVVISNNGTKTDDSTEGLFVAYTSLFLMAIGPIYIGSLRSAHNFLKKKKSGESMDTISSHDAMMFPLLASGALLGIYIFFQIFSKEYINLLLTFYFFALGILALSHLIIPYFDRLIPSNFPNSKYTCTLIEEKEVLNKETQTQEVKKTEHFCFNYERKDLLSLAVSIGTGIWYLKSKHWIANNIFGLAFSVNAVELLHLNKVSTGCILLGGLFIYDIFWVFGTNVMVTVAKSFEAPIKLIFPRDVLTQGLAAKNFAMLGLGDIVIPGIFIALLLRFDRSLNQNGKTYFCTGFFAYIVGLLTTMIVMHVFKHAQPALLYLVPTCLGFPILLALVKGQIKELFSYEDSPELEKSATDEATKGSDDRTENSVGKKVN